MLKIFMCVVFFVGYAHCKEDIYDLLSTLGCRSFAGLLQSTGYNYKLGDDHSGPYTVFAPTDDAFNNLPPAISNAIQSGNWEFAFDIVSYHITNDIFLLASLQNNGLYDSLLQYSQLRYNTYPSGIIKAHTISGANITIPDNTATNGVVHVIDRVLYRFPEVYTTHYIDESVNLTTLALLIDKGGLHDQLKVQNLTLFAPTDNAFDAAPKDFVKNLLVNDTAIESFLMKYVVNSVYFSSNLVNGQDLFTPTGNKIEINISHGNITVNGGDLVKADLITKNGVVHMIDHLF